MNEKVEEKEEEQYEKEVEVRKEARKELFLASLVLSMAFRMATFSFSRADRTLTYSPRWGVKYSGGEREKKEAPMSTLQHTLWPEQYATAGTTT